MLSGIIGDGLQMKEEDVKSIGSDSPKRAYKLDQLNRKNSVDEDELLMKRSFDRTDSDIPNFNYVHYDPELHWCRVCDVFPRSAKDLLNHLHSAEHRQVTQEHQLVDTPWHKLPTDEELPSFKGAPVKRVPIKGNVVYYYKFVSSRFTSNKKIAAHILEIILHQMEIYTLD